MLTAISEQSSRQCQVGDWEQGNLCRPVAGIQCCVDKLCTSGIIQVEVEAKEEVMNYCAGIDAPEPGLGD